MRFLCDLSSVCDRFFLYFFADNTFWSSCYGDKKNSVSGLPFTLFSFPRLEWLILQAFGLSDDVRQLLGARFFACDFTLAPALHARLTQATELTFAGCDVRLMS